MQQCHDEKGWALGYIPPNSDSHHGQLSRWLQCGTEVFPVHHLKTWCNGACLLEQQVPPAQYLNICASLHWWLLMLLSTYALGRHVHTRYSVSRPHDIILWLSIVFSTIISSWFLDYMILYFPHSFISCHVHFLPLRHCTTSECDIWGELLHIHDTLSYIILTMYL